MGCLRYRYRLVIFHLSEKVGVGFFYHCSSLLPSSFVTCLKSSSYPLIKLSKLPSQSPLIKLQVATKPIQITQPTSIRTGRVTSHCSGQVAHAHSSHFTTILIPLP